MKKVSMSYRIFTVAAYLGVGTVIVLTLMVFVHIVAIAFSSSGPANANIVGLWPVGFTTESMVQVLEDEMLPLAFLNSIKRVLLGVAINLVMMVSVAYPLSKEARRFPMRNVYAMAVLFTMLFSGGLVPLFLWVKQLNLMDKVWALVLPTSVPVFLCIVLMNFFKQIPDEIEDAAFIDGAGYFRVLTDIQLPLAKPALATVTLFSTINHWNSWFDGLIYMKKPAHYPYATYLRMLLERMNRFTSAEDLERLMRIGERPSAMAYVIIGIVPIALLYPFLQKHVKSGMMVGSVKG